MYLSLVTNVPTRIINKLNKVQKGFTWNGNNPKIKHSTLCNKYENGGLKNKDILTKVISLQCSWIKRLYDNSSHPWRIIPSYLIDTYLGENFKLHSNFGIPAIKIKNFPHIVNKYLRDAVRIYLHLLVSHRLLHLKLSGTMKVSK